MGTGIRTGLTAGALALAGLMVLSCGGNGGGTTDPPIEGTEIRVTVTVDGSGTSGVTVRLFQPGGTTPVSSTSTNANGTAVFANLSAGSFEVEVEVPAGTELDGPARRSVTVAEGSSATVAFQLTTGTSGDVVEVRLTSNLTFSPSNVTIQPGTTIRWVNDVTMFHTITPEGHTEWSEGSVTSAGETFQHTFTSSGTFAYFCSPHVADGMTGVITVE